MKFAQAVLISLLSIAPIGASAQGAAPTDPQIAHIVVTANQVDIDAGRLAESKGASKEVKDFGKQMVTDHTGVNQQAAALVKKLNVTPEDNPTSQSLKTGGAENVKMLPAAVSFFGASGWCAAARVAKAVTPRALATRRRGNVRIDMVAPFAAWT